MKPLNKLQRAIAFLDAADDSLRDWDKTLRVDDPAAIALREAQRLINEAIEKLTNQD